MIPWTEQNPSKFAAMYILPLQKIQNVKIIDCNILDFIEINILFEYNGLEIIIIKLSHLKVV